VRAWNRPDIPVLPGRSALPRLFDTASASQIEVATGETARLYVCGITPYDATHIGHANTYLAFDTLQRVWRDAGLPVRYAQNVTDVDDPLLDRARDTGVDWRELAASQVELFRADMEALRIVPPDDYVAVTEVIDEVAEAVAELLRLGLAYRLPVDDAGDDATGDEATGEDVYFDVAAASAAGPGGWHLGAESRLDGPAMLRMFAAHGGDPDRAGKRGTLDPLLWRAERPGEPVWETVVGRGRPGWHIECSVIALSRLGEDFAVQGGGSDLLFPHHEMSAAHASALSGAPLARCFSHAGMIGYQGEKMSKSLGNLVLVSRLREAGHDPAAVRLALLAHHYRSDWEWTPADLDAAERRLACWRAAASAPDATTGTSVGTERMLADLRAALADDLDTPAALAAVDAAAESGPGDAALFTDAVDALLGIRLR